MICICRFWFIYFAVLLPFKLIFTFFYDQLDRNAVLMLACFDMRSFIVKYLGCGDGRLYIYKIKLQLFIIGKDNWISSNDMWRCDWIQIICLIPVLLF